MSVDVAVPSLDGRLRFAGEVKALMGRHDVTQLRLAEYLGIGQPELSKRLKGRTPFKIDEILAIADGFGVSVGTLFGETTIPRPGGPDGGAGADDEIRTRNLLLGTQRLHLVAA